MTRFIPGALPVATPVLLGPVLLGLSLSCALPVRAQDNPAAHEHGAASLDIVLDGNQLLIDLDSPADNVLGFESEPTSDADRATLEAAGDLLGGDTLFVPAAAAQCALVDADVDLPFSDSEHDEHHEAGHDHEAHADVRASYTFSCDSPEQLSAIQTTLFEQFEGFERIDVQLVGPGGQTSLVLDGSGQPISLDAIR